MARKFPSWLQALSLYAEETEAPRQFWTWAGISTIASALQRKVWLPFGFEKLYANLFIILVGPPASRKAAPIKFSKNILKAIEIPVAVDSSSKRSFTQELAETAKREIFRYEGKQVPQCSLSVISPEMSTLLAVNPKEMIEVLTDLYDAPDWWDYKTSGKGEDRLYNVIVNSFIATTPTWLMENLPQSAIGGGFTSRFLIVYGDKVRARITVPWIRKFEDLKDSRRSKMQELLFRDLATDLREISSLVGEFTWTPEAYGAFDTWYKAIDTKLRETPDERLHGFIGRMHIMALKTAICLTVDTSNSLTLTAPVVEDAILRVEAVLSSASDAFGGHGRSRTGPDVQRILGQLKMLKRTTLKELMKLNYRHVTKSELLEILETIEAMALVKCVATTENPQGEVLYLGKQEPKEPLR